MQRRMASECTLLLKEQNAYKLNKHIIHTEIIQNPSGLTDMTFPIDSLRQLSGSAEFCKSNSGNDNEEKLHTKCHEDTNHPVLPFQVTIYSLCSGMKLLNAASQMPNIKSIQKPWFQSGAIWEGITQHIDKQVCIHRVRRALVCTNLCGRVLPYRTCLHGISNEIKSASLWVPVV